MSETLVRVEQQSPEVAADENFFPEAELQQPAGQDRSGIERRRRRRVVTYIALIGLLLAAMLLASALGQYPIAPSDVLRGLLSKFFPVTPPRDDTVMSVLWSIRFPRIALGILVGAALGVSGAVMQAVFSNPLAEPGIVGVSSGAAVGAALAIVFIPNLLAGFAVPLAAFATGLLAAFIVYFSSRSRGRAEVVTLVLVGIAVNALAGALTSIATYIAPTTARDSIVFWQMGSLAGASWVHTGVIGFVTAIGIVWALVLSRQLDTLALGEAAAGHVGVNVGRLRMSAIALSALLAAGAVAYAGVIAFVGLVIPHLLRLLIGPNNRVLIPATALGGALLITCADIAARNLIPYADLPIGIFTALVGAPVFFVLLRSGMRLGRSR